MSKEVTKIVNFSDLNAWKQAHKLYVEVYGATKRFPKEEVFGITSQIRRASLSVSSNIAEGFGRSSNADRLHFYVMARGSLYEVQNQLIAAHDVELIQRTTFEQLIETAYTAQRILIGLITATKKRTTTA